MNHRERAMAVLNYQVYDYLPIVHFGFWNETLDLWAGQGHITPALAQGWGDGNWAAEWLADNPGSELAVLAAGCGDCAHSQTLNCVLKGRAFWWMMARIAGWAGPGLDGDLDEDGDIESDDALILAEYLAGCLDDLPCDASRADCNHDGSVNVVDCVWIQHQCVR